MARVPDSWLSEHGWRTRSELPRAANGINPTIGSGRDARCMLPCAVIEKFEFPFDVFLCPSGSKYTLLVIDKR